jgi:hypothetical protein
VTDVSLTSGTDWLRDAAESHFKDVYQLGSVSGPEQIDAKLQWVPDFHFLIHDHLMVAVEVSETAYPAILAIRRVDLEKLQFPVSVYSVCPEQVYLAEQADAKRLINDGYGLLTVDDEGFVQKRASPTPILQVIHQEEFKERIAPLPQSARKRLARCFEAYTQNPPLGVSDITEVVEGMVLKAGRSAANKGWIEKKNAKPGNPFATLKAMQGSAQIQNCLAAVGGVQAYVSTWRNLSHHFPKNRKKAGQKYRECRHAFIDGIHHIQSFKECMGKLGIRVTF